MPRIGGSKQGKSKPQGHKTRKMTQQPLAFVIKRVSQTEFTAPKRWATESEPQYILRTQRAYDQYRVANA